MLDWFYDTPIVRAVLWIEKHPVVKKKANYKIAEELKRSRARSSRKKKNKHKKRMA